MLKENQTYFVGITLTIFYIALFTLLYDQFEGVISVLGLIPIFYISSKKGFRIGLISSVCIAIITIIMFNLYEAPLSRVLFGASFFIFIGGLIGKFSDSQAQFSESKLLYQTIFDKSPIGIAVAQDGIFKFANKSFLDIFGYDKKEELISKDMGIIYPVESKDSMRNRALNRERGFEEPDNYEFIGLTKQNKLIPIKSNSTRVFFPDGPAAMGFVQDQSIEKQLESEQKRLIAELETKNKDLEELGYFIFHDLSKPIRQANSTLQLLYEQLGDNIDSEVEELFEHVFRGFNKGWQLIQAIKQITLIPSDMQDTEVISLDQIIVDIINNDLADIIRQSNSRVEIKGSLPSIRADSSELYILFNNLISNAIKFRREGVKADISIYSIQNENDFEVVVSDNGRGIKESDIPHVFKMFSRFHPKVKGTGIGLPLCNKIVEKMNGKIHITSKLSKGTKFHIVFPKSINAESEKR